MVPDYRLDPPELPELRWVADCAGCGGEIMEGDEYYETISLEKWCMHCIIFKIATKE